MNTAIDSCTIAPTPSATATTCTYTPAAFPTTVASPARRPSVSDRVTTNSTLGPGTAMSTVAMTMNASRCSVGSMDADLRGASSTSRAARSPALTAPSM